MRPTSFVSRLVVVFLLGVAVILTFRSSVIVSTGTEVGVNMNLPSLVGKFSGKDQTLSEGEKVVLPKDTEITKKLYSDPDGDMINVEVVLAGAEKRSIHRPELCLPAQGWSINNRRVIPITLSDGRRISVMEVSISRPVETSPGVIRVLDGYYDYCFVGKGVTTPSHFTRLFLTSWDRVVHRRNHRWAYLAVSAPVLEGFRKDGKNAQETEKMMTDFIMQMAPGVMKRNEENPAPQKTEP